MSKLVSGSLGVIAVAALGVGGTAYWSGMQMENWYHEALAAAAQKRLAAPLAVLEAELHAQHAAGHAWLAGNRFTVADLCMASVVAWVLPARDLLATHPACKAWLSSCA